MVVVLFAVGVTLWFGRRMAQPMRGLAVAAYQIRTLKLDPPPHVNRSRLIELHDAAVAQKATKNVVLKVLGSQPIRRRNEPVDVFRIK